MNLKIYSGPHPDDNSVTVFGCHWTNAKKQRLGISINIPASASPDRVAMMFRHFADALWAQANNPDNEAIRNLDLSDNPLDKEYLRRMARKLETMLPDHHGFILFTFNYGPGGALYYTATCDRADGIKAVKEWLFKVGAEETWMQHIR